LVAGISVREGTAIGAAIVIGEIVTISFGFNLIVVKPEVEGVLTAIFTGEPVPSVTPG